MKTKPKSNAVCILAVLCSLAVIALFALGQFPKILLIWLGFCNVATYFLYYWDKQAAINGGYRTREYSLHLWALLGGWIGATFAQRRFRHKTQKTEFLFIFYLTIAINIAATVYLLFIQPYH